MNKSPNHGFDNMDPKKQRAIARMGGLAAHRKGTAHKWTPEEASKAGKKGGEALARRRAEEKLNRT